jgi:hypothetical protein
MYKYSQSPSETIIMETYKIFVPWMSKRTKTKFILDTFNRLKIGTIEQISMMKKFKNGAYFTCMIEFSNPTEKGYTGLFQHLDNPKAKIQVKHKFGFWQIKKFNEKPKETIEVTFPEEEETKTVEPQRCFNFEETYPDYFKQEEIIPPRPIFLEKPASPELVLPPPKSPPIFPPANPYFIHPLNFNNRPVSPSQLWHYQPSTPSLLWDEFPLYHSQNHF